MSTERLVKWSKESKEFFEKAEDNSVVLDLWLYRMGAQAKQEKGLKS
ncbi:MAG: hypothetical protein LBQ04_01165 [Endomicrobium sp.]|jgi:hypothetical protein|nr:hypothetical protein [Endomicrobium sp.]